MAEGHPHMASTARIAIAFFIPDLQLGGAERQLAVLAGNIDRALFLPIVITLRPGGALVQELEAQGIPIYCLGRCSAPRVLLRLQRVLHAAQVRILYSFLLPTNVYALAARALNPQVRVIIGTRNAIENPAAWEGTLRAKLKVKALLAIIALLRGLADAEIVNSHAAAVLAEQRRRPRVQLIPNGVDVSRWKPDSSGHARLCRELSIDSRNRIVVTVANCSPYKDYPTLIHAAEKVTARFRDVVFLAFGNDATAAGQAARQLVGELGLESRFIFAGVRNDLDRLLAGADVFCLSSATEGFSNAICEAMACGLPPVVTDVGDSAFIVGDAGMKVPAKNSSQLAEALCQLLDSGEELRRQFGENARERIVSQFSVEKMIQSHQNTFEGLVGASGKCNPAAVPGETGG
jgi:glycosyltransferase involved in cell wall biosynthesis